MWLQQNLALTVVPEDNVAKNLALTVVPEDNVATAELGTDSDARRQCGYSRTWH